MSGLERRSDVDHEFAPGLERLRLHSINHHTAALAELEQMVLRMGSAAEVRARLAQRGVPCVAVSTCNRTELYWCAQRDEDEDILETWLPPRAGESLQAPSGLVRHRGLDAATHLFRLAAGLESLMVGESEILGQLDRALGAAQRDGAASGFLSGLFHCAMRFGRRARTETGISAGALSVASAAVHLIVRALPNLHERRVVLIGSGETAITAGRHLRALSVGSLVVLSRTLQRGENAATLLEAERGTLDDLARHLEVADAVLAAPRTEVPLVTPRELTQARARGGAATLLMIDLALPRAIDPDVAALDGVVLHDLGNLDGIVTENRARREAEMPKVEALLEQELRIFRSWSHQQRIRPLVKTLRARAEDIRREEVEQALVETPLDREAVDHLTRRIVNRLLHVPTLALKSLEAHHETARMQDLMEFLGLDAEEAG